MRAGVVLRTFGPFLRPQWPGCLLAGVLAVAGAGIALLKPWPLKYLFDEVLLPSAHLPPEAVQGVLVLVVVALAGIAVLDSLTGALRSYALTVVGERVAADIRTRLYDHLQRLSLAYHERTPTGELTTRLTGDVDKVRGLLTVTFVDAATNVLTLAGMAGVMLVLDWQLSVALLLVLPLLLLTVASFRARIRAVEENSREIEGDLAAMAQESLVAVKLVKATGREEHEARRFRARSDASVAAVLRSARTSAAFGAAVDAVVAMATTGLIWLGAQRVLAGALTPGDLVIFTSYLRDFFGPTRALSKLPAQLTRAGVRAARIADTLHRRPAVQDKPGARAAGPPRVGLSLDGVGFAYNPDHPVLRDVDLAVPVGTTLAIVGPTGAGKSTIAALLCRLQDPTSGRVRLDDADLRDLTGESLHTQVGLVTQDALLFRASVRPCVRASVRPCVRAGEHRLRASRRLGGRGREGRPRRPGPRLRAGAAERLRDDSGRARGDAVRRAATAAGAGTRGPAGLPGPRARRADDRFGRPFRGRGDARASGGHHRADHGDHHAPDGGRDGRGRDRRPRRGADRGARYPPPAHRGGRPLHRDVPSAGDHRPPGVPEVWRRRLRAPRCPSSRRRIRPDRQPPESSPDMTESSAQPVPSDRSAIPDTAAAAPDRQLLMRSSVACQGGRLPVMAVDEPALFPVLEKAYDLGRWREWRRTEQGTSNVSWFVRTDAGEVVLRRSHNLKTVAGAEFECALIDHLRGHGYPAPPVQRTRDGAVLVQVEGVLHMVMRLMPGRAYDPGDTAQLMAVARGLGRYHAIVSELTLPGEWQRSSALASLGQLGQENLYAAVDVVAPLLAADAGAALRRDARYLAERMERLNVGLGKRQEDLTSLVIHGSYGQSAVLVDGGRLTAVLDFDRAAQDLLGLDVAYAVRSFCREGTLRRYGVGIDRDRCRAFLHYYRSQAPLTEADLAAMPDVFQAQRLIVIAKKCYNLLTKQAIVPRQSKDAIKFALLLERECARVRWLTDNPFTMTEDT